MVVAADEGKGAKETVAHEVVACSPNPHPNPHPTPTLPLPLYPTPSQVVANVLVGAEEAEARLEGLLQRRRELLGEA